MADFLLVIGDSAAAGKNSTDTANAVIIGLGLNNFCKIYGKEGTYNVIRDGEDAIISLGYVCWAAGDSLRETLVQVLNSFQESQISDLKKGLIGEYILLVKKGPKICIFSDFAGVRNVFYSNDGKIISSSFSRMEDTLGAGESDLDPYKLVEYIAMRSVTYAAWLGSSTCHKRINWLLPYEYLVFDTENGGFGTRPVVYSLDNTKQPDCASLSNELISVLQKIVGRKEFEKSKVAVSLTGGHDSRLIAAIACKEFPDLHFRTAASTMNPDTKRDLKIARKVARVHHTPIDVYWFQYGRDEERFRDLTEGFSPLYNRTIAPLLDAAGAYALGFGGIFGTELFTELPYNSIDDFIEKKIAVAKQILKMDNVFWQGFRESIRGEFGRIKNHFHLTIADDRDYIRLFGFVVTARYCSFITSAFNRTGYQIDPYGSFSVLDLALRVPPVLWGNHKRLVGNCLVQKAALSKVNPRMGKLLTFNHSRPMLPLSARTFPMYLAGYLQQIGTVFSQRYAKRRQKLQRTDLPGGYYISDGWEAQYLSRLMKRYDMPTQDNCSS